MHIENAYPIIFDYAFVSYIKEISLRDVRFRLHLHLTVVHCGVMFVFSVMETPRMVWSELELRCHPPTLVVYGYVIVIVIAHLSLRYFVSVFRNIVASILPIADVNFCVTL